MAVLYEILWLLTVIFLSVMCKAVGSIGFLKNSITDIFFILKHLINVISCPLSTAVSASCTHFRELSGNFCSTVAHSVIAEYQPDNLSLIFNNTGLFIFIQSISEHLVEFIADITLSEGSFDTPCDILADRFTFRLCK